MFESWQRLIAILMALLLTASCSHAVDSLSISEQQLNEQLEAQYREPRLLYLELALGTSAQLYVTDVSIDLLGEGTARFRVLGDFDLEFGGSALTDPVPFSLTAVGSLGFDAEQVALFPWQLSVDKVTIETDVAAVHFPLAEALGIRVAEALEELPVYRVDADQLPGPDRIIQLAIEPGEVQLWFGNFPVR